MKILLFFMLIGSLRADLIEELDAYWGRVSAAVKEGDFEGYQATCHPDGVLISGEKETIVPLSDALKKWKVEFDDTKAGKMSASVDFRFSKRIAQGNLAHETGIFRYQATADGKTTIAYVYLDALLVKKDRWLITMEHQKGRATKAEWDALKT